MSGASLTGLSRREFIAAAGASALALVRDTDATSLAGRELAGRESLESIGLQLYTVRGEMEKSADVTLERVARVGYREVEFAGYFGKSAKEIRALLDANGLTSPSAHSADFTTIRTRWPLALEDAHVIGHRYLVCASIPRREGQTLDDWKRIAAFFNKAGEESKRTGVQFGFHNHAEVFAAIGGADAGGRTGYDILLSETDRRLLQMQLDLYWIVRGGKDPLDYFARHRGRFFSVHVKDMNAEGKMSDVGAGRLPFRGYFAAAKRAGVKHWFVEHDEPADPFASIRASYDYLKAMKF